MGETLLGVGEAQAAITHHQAALAITERTGDLYEHARALEGLDGSRRRWRSTYGWAYRRLSGSAGSAVDGQIRRRRGRSGGGAPAEGAGLSIADDRVEDRIRGHRHATFLIVRFACHPAVTAVGTP